MCKWVLMRNSELSEVPNKPKWIYIKRSNYVSMASDVKSGIKFEPKQTQMDLHKTEPLGVDGF